MRGRDRERRAMTCWKYDEDDDRMRRDEARGHRRLPPLLLAWHRTDCGQTLPHLNRLALIRRPRVACMVSNGLRATNCFPSFNLTATANADPRCCLSSKAISTTQANPTSTRGLTAVPRSASALLAAYAEELCGQSSHEQKS